MMMHVLKHGNLVFGGILFTLIIIAVVLGPFLTPFDPIEPDWGEVSLPPGGGHLFGTDEFGRDVLARILYGGRITVVVALSAQIVNSIIGISLGLMAAYFGGKLDDFIMGLVNVLLALPPLILGISILVVLGPSMLNVLVAIGLIYWTYTCRLTRSRVLSIKGEYYVESAKAIGTSNFRIMWRHILPNSLGPILVVASLGLGDTMLLLATFGFLGMGIRPPTPEWGSMLSEGRTYLFSAPWVTIFPGIAIFLAVLAVNLLGDGFRDIIDPYLNQ